jgi:hypothetical protein
VLLYVLFSALRVETALENVDDIPDSLRWRYRAIEATLVHMFNQKLQQGWDQIRAADAISD